MSRVLVRPESAQPDELDELEPPFTAYDRLRFAGPVSRDTLITAVRRDFPQPVDAVDS